MAKVVPISNRAETTNQVAIMGYWAALLATVFSVLFLVAAIFSVVLSPPGPWAGIEVYAGAFRDIQLISFIPCLLLAPTLVVMMAAIYAYTPAPKKTFSLLGVIFASVYMVIGSINYYLQLTIVRQNLHSGSLEGLALLASTNSHSLFFAFEALGYGFLGLATFFAAPVFAGGRLERYTRMLFIVNGILGLAGVIGFMAYNLVLVFGALVLWCLLFPITTTLVAVIFKRQRAIKQLEVSRTASATR